VSKLKRGLLLALGVLAVALGAVGVVVPLLPTTPFLLLAAFLFARSSERLHHWLLSNRLLGDYLRRYYEGRSMTRRHKVMTLSLLWITLGATIVFVAGAWWLRGLLFGIGAAVSTHIMRLHSG